MQIDHIHLVLWIPPKYSVSELVRFLKGKSAFKILDRHLELKLTECNVVRLIQSRSVEVLTDAVSLRILSLGFRMVDIVNCQE